MLSFLLLSLTAAPDFDAAKAVAKPIGSLERFLSETVGDCEGEADARFDRAGCRAQAAAARAERAGQTFVLQVDNLRGRLEEPVWDPKKRAFRALMVPIFVGADLALTVGSPLRVDGEGRPIVRKLPLWLELPSGLPEFIFRRDVGRGRVAAEFLVALDAPWSKGRGRRAARGLSVRLLGWRLSHRNGVLGEWVSPQATRNSKE